MSDVERRIREALAEVDGSEPVPGFRDLWGRAEGRARARAREDRWRGLAPVAALGAAAVAVALVAVLAPGPAPEQRAAPEGPGAAAAGLDALAIPELSSLPSDDLMESVIRPDDVDRELLLAWNDKMLGSQTDWLLTLDIPVWDREEERKMP